jgi:nucleotide-binding universal stress UspA family protein
VFKKIIWATDGSESADRALEFAKGLASQDGAVLLAVHSVEHMAGRGGGLPVDADEDERQAKINGQVGELKEQGVNITLKVVQGGATGAAHTLAHVAQDEAADVIVIGTRGHTALAGLLVGSVTQRILHVAPCPVLVVPAAK